MLGPINVHGSTIDALRRALETPGVQFIPETGGGPGIRLRAPSLATGRRISLTPEVGCKHVLGGQHQTECRSK